jgi:hypothetical protein
MSWKKQEIYMNNHTTPLINNSNSVMIWDLIDNPDIEAIKNINNQISNPYQIKLSFIQNFLNSNQPYPIKSLKDLNKLFKILSPLNIEYNLGSNVWNKKISHSKLFIQNSISKKESSDIFYNKYINKVKNILVLSGVQFNYFEFKSKRFNKTKDIIWVFDLEQFNN